MLAWLLAADGQDWTGRLCHDLVRSRLSEVRRRSDMPLYVPHT
jgi:hypothetical protein